MKKRLFAIPLIIVLGCSKPDIPILPVRSGEASLPFRIEDHGPDPEATPQNEVIVNPINSTIPEINKKAEEILQIDELPSVPSIELEPLPSASSSRRAAAKPKQWYRVLGSPGVWAWGRLSDENTIVDIEYYTNHPW